MKPIFHIQLIKQERRKKQGRKNINTKTYTKNFPQACYSELKKSTKQIETMHVLIINYHIIKKPSSSNDQFQAESAWRLLGHAVSPVHCPFWRPRSSEIHHSCLGASVASPFLPTTTLSLSLDSSFSKNNNNNDPDWLIHV